MTNRYATLAFGLLLTAAPVFAQAQPPPDFCITFPPPFTYTLVGVGYKMPPKGRCNAWNGFSPYGGFMAPTSGTGCVSSDGTHFDLTLTTHSPTASTVLFDAIDFTLPLGSPGSTASEEGIEIGQSFGPGEAEALGNPTCRMSDNPIPSVRDGEQPQLRGLR